MATLKNLLTQEAKLVSQQAALSSQQQALEHSLTAVRLRIAQMRNMHAATYNLPNETLCAIFEAGRSNTSCPTPREEAFLDRSTQPLPIPFEIIVSAVSRRWRNVALQTPRLWTDIYINFKRPMQGLHDLYLSRSKSCLLDITLVPFARDKEFDITHTRDVGIMFEQYMALLIPHVVRWRKLAIHKAFVGEESAPYSVLAHLYAPALETLVAEIHSQPRLAMDVFSGGASRLSSVELTGVYFRPPQSAVKNLNLYYTLVGSLLSYNQFSQLIRPMSSLTHITMDLNISTDANHPSIELPSLISLDYRLSDGSVGVLRFLDCPAVEELTFHGYSHRVIGAVVHHGRLYPTVLSLTMASDDHADRDSRLATAFMSLLPNIQGVTFRGTGTTSILYSLQHRKSTGELLWPHLSDITVTPARNATIQAKKNIWDNIVEVVQSRIQLGTPISRITLSSQIIDRISNKQQRLLREQVTLIQC